MQNNFTVAPFWVKELAVTRYNLLENLFLTIKESCLYAPGPYLLVIYVNGKEEKNMYISLEAEQSIRSCSKDLDQLIAYLKGAEEVSATWLANIIEAAVRSNKPGFATDDSIRIAAKTGLVSEPELANNDSEVFCHHFSCGYSF